MKKMTALTIGSLFTFTVFGTTASAIGSAGGMYPPQKATPIKPKYDKGRKRASQESVPAVYETKTKSRINNKNSVPGIGDETRRKGKKPKIKQKTSKYPQTDVFNTK